MIERSLRLGHRRRGKLHKEEGRRVSSINLPAHGGTLNNGGVYLTHVREDCVGLHAGRLVRQDADVARTTIQILNVLDSVYVLQSDTFGDSVHDG